jgi:hypothetical protein
LPTSNCNFKNFPGVIPPDPELQGKEEGGRGRARVKIGREGKERGGKGREGSGAEGREGRREGGKGTKRSSDFRGEVCSIALGGIDAPATESLYRLVHG